VSLTLHRISAVLFYLLGLSFFGAYLLLVNEIVVRTAAWWLQRADLPFALVTLLYGGTGFYWSLHRSDKPGKAFAIIITIPLVALFLFLVILNFWDVLPLPQGTPML